MLTHSQETLRVLSLSLEPEVVIELTSQTNSQVLEVWGTQKKPAQLSPPDTFTIEGEEDGHLVEGIKRTE